MGILAKTAKQVEAAPESYPVWTVSDFGSVSPITVWQRLEAYTAHRWTPREVVWTVIGPGDWSAPLTPATISVTEMWGSAGWEAYTLPDGPMGFDLPLGAYRITATVGDVAHDPPYAVLEAYRRLGEYMSEVPEKPGAGRYSLDIGGAFNESFDRNPAWLARAMQLSGAGDLLRPYRRVA